MNTIVIFILAVTIGMFTHLWTNKLIQDGEVFSFVSKFLNYLITGDIRKSYDADNIKSSWKYFIHKSLTCGTCIAIQWCLIISLFNGFALTVAFIFITLGGFTSYYLDNKIL
jgi:hypothetical protein